MSTALITGITGQDGALLARSLIQDGVQVFGLTRQSTSERSLVPGPPGIGSPATVLERDVASIGDALAILDKVQPDQIFNLAAQSSVAGANAAVIPAIQANALAPAIWLEALRSSGGACRFLQASSGEVFGSDPGTKNESSSLAPANIYGATKSFAQQMCEIYSRSFGIHASSAILFAHESPLRNENFLTRKVTRGLARIKAGLQDDLSLGNLDARRDWGAASDYVEGMRLAISAPAPGSYVFATGEARSVRDFVNAAAAALGLELTWTGQGDQETAVDQATGRPIVKVDPQFYRPVDPGTLVGDPTKAEQELGWRRKFSFQDIVAEMAQSDLSQAYAEARSILR